MLGNRLLENKGVYLVQVTPWAAYLRVRWAHKGRTASSLCSLLPFLTFENRMLYEDNEDEYAQYYDYGPDDEEEEGEHVSRLGQG